MMRELDDGDGELLRLLVSQFVADAADQLARLGEAVAEGDPEVVVQVAHNLKGASSSVGALSLAEMCARLEGLARAAALDTASELVDAMVAELGRVRTALDLVVAG